MEQTAPRVRYPALRHRNFVLIWAGLLVSNMGTWMQNVAQSWLIYRLTGNDLHYLGWLGLSFAIPMVVVPPLGGVLVDRVNRIKLLYVTQTGSLLLAALLAALTWSGLVQPAHILITTFLGSLLLAFDNPSRQALIPDLVPRADLLNALSLNSSTYTGAALAGPALAGLLLEPLGAGWLFMLNAVSYLAVLGALRAMRGLPPERRSPAPLGQALRAGFSYVLRNGVVLLLLLLSALAAVFGRSYLQLLPAFADQVWLTGSVGYGALVSAGGAGALLGAFAMASVTQIERPGLVLVGSGLVFCAALLAFALCPWFWVAVALLVVVGVASTAFTTMIATLIQLRVPGELRGRVMSIYAVTLIGLPSLGSLGLAAVATALEGQGRTVWSRPALGLLDLIGVGGWTARLGEGAGPPRAVTLCAAVLALVLLAAAPMLRSRRLAHEG